jgi:opine dehydrogenase
MLNRLLKRTQSAQIHMDLVDRRAPTISAHLPHLHSRKRAQNGDNRGQAGELGATSVAVLGSGHGGLALAGHLAIRGFRVALWNRSPTRIAEVRNSGRIQLTLPGVAPVAAPIALASCRIGAVLSCAQIVLVTVPASGHADVARASAPYLRDGQTVLLLPGRTGGALEFRNVLREAGCRAQILLGEASSFPFAARCVGPAAGVIYGAKTELPAAALPSDRTAELIAACRPLLPMLVPAPSVLHTGLANVGAILHPTITLLNADRIQAGDTFDFYSEGVTPHVAAVLAAADAERLRIARAFGVTTSSLQAWVAASYCHHASTILESVGGNPSYAGIKAPTTIVHRYLLEDVPTGLIPLLELGRAAGLASPTLAKLVKMAQVKLGSNVWSEERTLTSLGLAGLTPGEVRAVVQNDLMTAPMRSPIVRSKLAAAYSPSGA